jgi:hypothetical protein
MLSPSELSVSVFCNQVMRAVVASGVVTKANIDRAIEVMRAEVKALLFGDEYATQRAAVAGSPDGALGAAVMATVVAACIAKIKGA